MSQPEPNLRLDMRLLTNDDLINAIPKATKDELLITAVSLVNELIRRGFHPENTPIGVVRSLEAITGQGTFRKTWEAVIRSERFNSTAPQTEDQLLAKTPLGRAALNKEKRL